MALVNEQAPRTRDVLLQVIRDNPGLTEKELGDLTGFSTSKLTPTRIRLWEAGEIEPTTEAGWKRALVSRVKAVRWQVASPERQDSVGARAQTREKRNAKSVEARATRIVDDFRDPTVYRLVMKLLDQEGLSSRQTRRGADALRKQESVRKRAARQAERDKSANADMQRKLALLWDARSTIAAVDDHLMEERARVVRDEPRRISDGDWLVALRDVLMILQSFGSIWDNIKDLGDDMSCPVCGVARTAEHKHLRAFAIDADAEDEDDLVDAEVLADKAYGIDVP
jgi:hypothetical protein